MKYLFLVFVLSLCGLAHAQIPQFDPERTGEFLIDTNINYVYTGGTFSSPDIAFDGTNYLIVWKEIRGGIDIIGGIKVNHAGIPVDSNLISIASGSSIDLLGAPHIAFDGGNYLVVWRHFHNPSDYHFQFQEIAGNFVTPRGNVLYRPYFTIHQGGLMYQGWFLYEKTDVTGSGLGSCLVVCAGTQAAQDYDYVLGRQVYSGALGTPVQINYNEYAGPYNTTCSFDGTNFLAAWQKGFIMGARISLSDSLLDPSGFVISNGTAINPAIAYDNTNYLVTWQSGSTSNYDIKGSRVTPNAVVLDPNAIAISTAPNNQQNPKIAFDGTNYTVAWDDYRSNPRIFINRITPNGAILDSSGRMICNKPTIGDIAFGDSIYLTVLANAGQIWGCRSTKDGLPLDVNGILYTGKGNAQGCPAASYDGTNYMVVWEDNDINTKDIRGMRVSALGALLDPVKIYISTAPDIQTSPSISFGSNQFLCVWQDRRNGTDYDIYGARIDASGTLLDPGGIPIARAAYEQSWTAVAYDGVNYLCVWQDRRNGGNYDIYGARIDTLGTVLDTTGIPIARMPYDQLHPSVAYDGTNYFVVWVDINYDNDNGVRGTRVTPDGLVIDTSGILIADYSLKNVLDITFGGTNYLVVWDDYEYYVWRDIYGSRVTPDGTVLDPTGFIISHGADDQVNPDVVFDGTNYVVAWEDRRYSPDGDIIGAKVSPAGSVIEEISISRQDKKQLQPAMSAGSDGQVLFTWTGWTDITNGRLYNQMRTWGKIMPQAGVQEKQHLAASLWPGSALRVSPNPFRKQTNVQWQIRDDDINHATLNIYDATGRLIKSIDIADRQPQALSMTWDATDDYGRQVPRGVYFLQLRTSKDIINEKIVLLK